MNSLWFQAGATIDDWNEKPSRRASSSVGKWFEGGKKRATGIIAL